MTGYIPQSQNGITADWVARLAKLEVHIHHLSQRHMEERSARLALRTEMHHLHELQQSEQDELRKDREAMIRRFGGWAIKLLALLAGVLASAAFNIDFPDLAWLF